MRTTVLTPVPNAAVILVAGTGTRLLPLTADRPKCLVEIGGGTILSRLLQQLASAGLKNIFLATGFREDSIRTWVAQHPTSGLEISFVANPAYATTNNAQSLWTTRSAVGDRSFLLCDGDVLLRPGVMERLLAHPSENALLVEPRTDMGDEEMKALVENDRVTKLSKAIDPKRAFGESIGIQKVGPAIWKTLEAMIAAGGANRYYEDAFQLMIDGGAHFSAVPVNGDEWIEIDDMADLERARARFGPA